MKTRSGVWAAAGCAVLCATALAQTGADVRVLSPQQELLARFERFSDAQLKEYFLLCSRDASERLLALDEGALCSAAQDALKNRSFAGDFGALLAWWRVHRDDPVAGRARTHHCTTASPIDLPASGSGSCAGAFHENEVDAIACPRGARVGSGSVERANAR